MCRRRNLILLSMLVLSGCGTHEAPASQEPVIRAAAASSVPAARWFRPTPRPAVDTATQLTNLSNLPGYDRAPSVAVHPTDGWAAVVWANVLPDSDEANVYVRVQDPVSGEWQPGISVNTLPAMQYADHPTLAIDVEDRIHVLFAQDGHKVYYSRSTDYGRTWTAPERVATPTAGGDGMALRAAVDDADVLHVVYIAGDCGFDCFHTWYVQRPAAAKPGTAWSSPTRPLPGTKHLRADLVTFGRRVMVSAACPKGCGTSRPVVAIRDAGGAWKERRIGGNVTHDDWEINWISAVRAGENRVCVAWSHYAHSGTYSSCSFDRGDTWEAAKPIIETYPAQDGADSGYTPSLLYEPLSDTLMAVQIYAQAGDGDRQTIYPVFSIRRMHEDHWIPDVAGPFRHPNRSVPFRLFEASTKSTYAFAREGLRVGYIGSGLALAVWTENAQQESIDVYAGWFHPAALLAEVQ